MKRRTVVCSAAIWALVHVASASDAARGELVGPARFCGYSPIIDLLPKERIMAGVGGMHGGSFDWDGAFGRLHVTGIGWAAKPTGRVVGKTPAGAWRYHVRREEGRYVVAIWNGRQGVAFFSSPRPFDPAKLSAIDRVALFQEGEEPAGCQLRTRFAWE